MLGEHEGPSGRQAPPRLPHSQSYTQHRPALSNEECYLLTQVIIISKRAPWGAGLAPVIGSVAAPGLHSPSRNEAVFPSEVLVGLPAATSKLRTFKETHWNSERAYNSVVSPFINLIQFGCNVPQSKLRKKKNQPSK